MVEGRKLETGSADSITIFLLKRIFASWIPMAFAVTPPSFSCSRNEILYIKRDGQWRTEKAKHKYLFPMCFYPELHLRTPRHATSYWVIHSIVAPLWGPQTNNHLVLRIPSPKASYSETPLLPLILMAWPLCQGEILYIPSLPLCPISQAPSQAAPPGGLIPPGSHKVGSADPKLWFRRSGSVVCI